MRTVTIGFILSYLSEAIIGWQYFSGLFKAKRKYNLLPIFVGYAILFVIGTFQIPWLNMIAFLGLNFACMYYFYHSDIKEAGLYTILLFGALQITGVLTNILATWRGGTYFNYRDDIYYVILKTTISQLVYLFAVRFILMAISILKKRRQNLTYLLFLYILPSVSIYIVAVINTLFLKIHISTFFDVALMIEGILLVSLNICTFSFYDHMQRASQQLIRLELQRQSEVADMEYYEMLTKQNENQRILIHDIKNHLQAIQILNDSGNTEKLTAYIHQLVQSPELQSGKTLCKNKVLNSILWKYQSICEAKGISFEVNVRNESIDYLQDNEIVALFSNLVENAVEAAEKIENSYIELETEYKKEQNATLITIVNSCQQRPHYSRAGSLITSKKDKVIHGLGTKSIQNIVKMYDGNLQNYYQESDHTFHTIILIYPKG